MGHYAYQVLSRLLENRTHQRWSLLQICEQVLRLRLADVARSASGGEVTSLFVGRRLPG